jgi:hypothetical protein
MDFLIFNDLSYPFKNKYAANEGIKTFIKTFAAASHMGINQLRLHKNIGENLYNLELAPGYYVSHWLHTFTHTDKQTKEKSRSRPGETIEDEALNEDLRNRFKEILTTSPMITDNEPIEKETNERSTFEISIPGKPKLIDAEGLGAAFLLDTIALSFLSGDFWDTHKIQKLKHYYIKDDNSEIVDFVEVRHTSRPEHMLHHKKWFEKKKLASLKASRELWERRGEFFPHMVLCGSVEQQLTKHYGVHSKYFNQIVERLKQLDIFAGDWTSGGWSDKDLKHYGLNVSGESEQTMQKYGRERRFRLPDGRKESFEKHIKTGDLRFHFYADEKDHRIYVGYIGPHLRTGTG